MPDLKISQFVDGGLVENTDEIAVVRAGVNTKVTAGSAARYEVGTGSGQIPTNDDLGNASLADIGSNTGDVIGVVDNGKYPALDGSDITNIKIPVSNDDAEPDYLENKFEAGSNITLQTITDSFGVEKIQITASGTVSLAASNVTYNNTTSGLAATNAQDAIDEVVEGVNERGRFIAYARVIIAGTGGPTYIVPAWANRIQIFCNDVGHAASSGVQQFAVAMRVGGAGVFSDYNSKTTRLFHNTQPIVLSYTAGFGVSLNTNTYRFGGVVNLYNRGNNVWVSDHTGIAEDQLTVITGGGSKAFAGVVDGFILYVPTSINFQSGSVRVIISEN